MLNFEGLVKASAKVVKEFINFLYNNARKVYVTFKRWLLHQTGAFKRAEAWVDSFYDYIEQTEEEQWFECASYLSLEEEYTMAEAKLAHLCPDIDGQKDFANHELEALEDVFSLSIQVEIFDLVIANACDLSKRKRQAQSERRRAVSKLKAEQQIKESLDVTVFEPETFPDIEELTTVRVIQDFDVKTGKPKEVYRRMMRPERKKDIAKFVRTFVRNKNLRLGADELSFATTQRYVEQLCDGLNFTEMDKAYCIRAACTLVPQITRQDIENAMIVHSNAAKAHRHQLEIISGGF
jgi:hypothetical protein